MLLLKGMIPFCRSIFIVWSDGENQIRQWQSYNLKNQNNMPLDTSNPPFITQSKLKKELYRYITYNDFRQVIKLVSIAVCDDEMLDCRNVEKDIKEILGETDIPFIVRQFSSGRDLLNTIENFDIIFLDIMMCGMNGMKTAQLLRDKPFDKILIFISASRDYVFEAYDVEAIQYLVKPVDYFKLKRVLQKAVKKLENHSQEFMIINQDRTRKKLLLREIYYFEIRGRVISVHGVEGIFDYYEQIGTLHDMKNHLLALHGLWKKEEFDKAGNYLEKMMESGNIGGSDEVTGNHAIDALLYNKKKEAGELSIQWVGDVQIPKKCTVDEFDLCVLFGNLLDNAIKACAETTDVEYCFVDIQSQQVKKCLLMVMKNGTVIKDIKEIRQEIGFFNIYETVRKYDGTISMKVKNHVFEIFVLIPMDNDGYNVKQIV